MEVVKVYILNVQKKLQFTQSLAVSNIYRINVIYVKLQELHICKYGCNSVAM